MTQRFYTLAAALLAATALMVAQSGRTIQVDVTYTGSGTVDAGHKIYVNLWPSADIGTGPPVDMQSLASKSGTVTFENVTVPAYISTTYDPTGVWDAQSAPPSGSSLGMYGKPDPINVAPGKTTKITLTFNDEYTKP